MGRIIPDIMETKCLKPPTSPIWLLVGGFNPLKKYEFVSWDDDIPNICKNKRCAKPPTRKYIEKGHPTKKHGTYYTVLSCFFMG